MRRSTRPTRPERDSAGRRAFAKVVKERTQAAVAKELEIGQQTVSVYVRGLARPGELVRARMDSAYGIPATDWLTAEERRYLERGSQKRNGTDG